MTEAEYRPQGIFRDRLLRPGGSVRDLGWRHNLVVDRCRLLLAAFLRGDGALGIQSLRLGRGLAEWDQTPPPPPARGDQQLVDPTPFVVPLAAEDIVYLDVVGEPTAGPTHRLGISVTLAPGQPPPPDGETAYPLREFGLFGDLGGEDFMINYVRHPVIHKQAGDTLERTLELTL